MVRFVFSVEDLSRTRFAISPMLELVHSLLALRDPSHAALQVPWLRSLSGRLQGLPLERAAALHPPRGYSPDFVLPLPDGPLGDISDDLAALRATPIARIRSDMSLFASQHKRGPQIAEPYLTNPRREVRLLADLFEAYWARAIDPVWPRIRAFLDADIAHRARRLTAGGPTALFGDLNPRVSWDAPEPRRRDPRPQRDRQPRRPRAAARAVGVRGQPSIRDRPRSVAADGDLSRAWHRDTVATGAGGARRASAPARRLARGDARRPRRPPIDRRAGQAAVAQPSHGVASPHGVARRRPRHRQT